MGWIILIGLIVIAVVIALNAIVIIPTVYFGIVTRFKERIKRNGKVRILREGLNTIAPFIDKVVLFSRELQTKSLSFDVFSMDRLEIKTAGSIQWRPDNLDVFIEMQEKTIVDGMADAVKSELGKIAGIKEGDNFIRSRRALEIFINCVLRLEKPPHHWVNPVRDNKGKVEKYEMDEECLKEYLVDIEKSVKGEEYNEIAEKIEKSRWQLPIVLKEEKGEKEIVLDELSFYEQNITRASFLLEQEAELKEKLSSIEKLYGIDIAIFRLADVDFSEATKKALESVRQAGAEMEAAQKRQEQKVKMINEYVNMKLPEQLAVNLAETAMTGKATIDRKIISLEGLDLLSNLLKNWKERKNGS